jgi:hypothetical protein
MNAREIHVKRMPLTEFCKQSDIPASLIRAVAQQVGGWSEFQGMAGDVMSHGADQGFSGFIYYTETCEFYARNRADIVALAEDMARDLGEASVCGMVLGFDCLRGSATEDEVASTLYGAKRRHNYLVANALAWFALEEVARAYDDLEN